MYAYGTPQEYTWSHPDVLPFPRGQQTFNQQPSGRPQAQQWDDSFWNMRPAPGGFGNPQGGQFRGPAQGFGGSQPGPKFTNYSGWQPAGQPSGSQGAFPQPSAPQSQSFGKWSAVYQKPQTFRPGQAQGMPAPSQGNPYPGKQAWGDVVQMGDWAQPWFSSKKSPAR